MLILDRHFDLKESSMRTCKLHRHFKDFFTEEILMELKLG